MTQDTMATGALAWIDVSACALVAVFFVLGVFRGFVWQISRVATVVIGYLLATLFGPFVAQRIAGWFPAETAPDLPRYTAYLIVFLGVVIVVGVIAGVVHRLVERSMLSFFNRVGGGLLGVATGWLFVMCGLTAVQVAYEQAGLGRAVAEAASRSRSAAVSERVLLATDHVIPTPWRRVTAAWRNLLRGAEVVEGGQGVEPTAADVRREPRPRESPGDAADRGRQSPR